MCRHPILQETALVIRKPCLWPFKACFAGCKVEGFSCCWHPISHLIKPDVGEGGKERAACGSWPVQQTGCIQSCLAAICLALRQRVACQQQQEAVGRRQDILGSSWDIRSICIPLVAFYIKIWNKGGYKFNTQQLGWIKSRLSQSTVRVLHFRSTHTWHIIKNNYSEIAILTLVRDNLTGHVVKFKSSLEKWTGETMLLEKPPPTKSHQFQQG